MPNHRMGGAHRSAADIPISDENLFDLDLGEHLEISGPLHRRLHLGDCWEVRTQHSSVRLVFCRGPDRMPGLGKVEDDSIGFNVLDVRGHVADV